MPEKNFNNPDAFNWPDDPAMQVPGGYEGTYDAESRQPRPRGAVMAGKTVVNYTVEMV